MLDSSRLFLLSIAVAMSLPTTASAQRRGEIILFSQPDYRGQSYTVSGSRERLPILWQVRSARVAQGDAWDLCTRTAFRTPCNRIAQSTPNARWVIQSVRPSQVVTLPEPVPPPAGASLRGMSAEFFPAPTDGRGRVVSCASGAAACARDSANRFCRSRGWTAASYHRQETVNRTNFLADVLCTRTGG